MGWLLTEGFIVVGRGDLYPWADLGLVSPPVPVSDTGGVIRGRRARPADVACGAGIAAGIVASYVLAGLTPSLLRRHVVLLEALSGSSVAIVTGGAFARSGRSSLLLVALAPLCTVVLYDAFLWWAGRLWGARVTESYTRRNPRAGRWVLRAERVVQRWGVLALVAAYSLPIPNVLIDVSCGAAEMPLWRFVAGDAAGLLLWEGLLIGLGWALGHPAVHVVDVVGRDAVPVTVVVVAVLVVVAVVRRHLGRTAHVVSGEEES